jgi:hypothetical protein
LLDTYPTTVAAMQVHIGDSYATSWGSSRDTFYGVTGTPTAWFDGVIQQVGGVSGMTYTGQYNQRHNIPSDITMLVGADEVDPPTTPPTYNVQISMTLNTGVAARPVRVWATQVLDYYPTSPSYSRNCLRNATTSSDITLNPGETVIIEKTLQIDAISAATPNNMSIFAWAQAPNGSAPAEVYQAAMMNYPFDALYAIKISLPDGVPEFVPPDASTVLNVRIQNGSEDLVPGTETLHYRFDEGEFLTAPLTPVSGEFYTATLPAPGCGALPEFYFSAQGNGGTSVFYPEDAPEDVLTTIVTTITDVMIDHFETDLGWTVWSDPSVTAGWWERGVPLTTGVTGCPLADYDGSGQCYLTDNRGNQDLDGGPTILYSPLLDLSAFSDVFVRYARWIYCDDTSVPMGQDFLDISFSNDGGATWVLARHVSGQGSWFYEQLRVLDYVTLSSQFQMRLSVSDNPNNSRTEAALDDVWFFDMSCDTTPQYAIGDMNCDGAVNTFDIDPFVLALTDSIAYAAAFPTCNFMLADANQDGYVNAFDIDPFVVLLTGGN